MAATSDQAKSGWGQTLEDMRAMARNREDAGYETLTFQAGNTAPKGPDQGDTDRWGLFYIIPGDDATSFQNALERADFDETAVYQTAIGRYAFLVTEVVDHDETLDLMIAGSYRRDAASPLVRAALDRDRMYSHVRTLDGTHLGTIEHDDPAAFFPDPDAIHAYEYRP
ncbi:MAG: hypothetical protein U5K70_03790 [Halodesulfurarchaeum sp.]|nr:hypothetical protein [Halodesulfurarchaeum sp.]